MRHRLGLPARVRERRAGARVPLCKVGLERDADLAMRECGGPLVHRRVDRGEVGVDHVRLGTAAGGVDLERLRVVREGVVVPALLERGVAVQPQRRLRGLELLDRTLALALALPLPLPLTLTLTRILTLTLTHH